MSYVCFEVLFFLKVSCVHLILLLKNYTTIIMLIKGVWVYKKSTASRLKRLPQGHPYKEPRALVFDATNGEPECTTVVEHGCVCVSEVKGRDIRAVYRARPIETDSTLTAKRTIGTNTETRRG